LISANINKSDKVS